MTRVTKKAALCGLLGAVGGWVIAALILSGGRGFEGKSGGLQLILSLPLGITVGGAVGLLLGTLLFSRNA